MACYVTLYHQVAWSEGEVVFDKEEWVVVRGTTGLHGVWHRHDDKYGGGRNGPPYLARCSPTHCQDCPDAPIPKELEGFNNLLNWKVKLDGTTHQ
jgi:hypothetical protein